MDNFGSYKEESLERSSKKGHKSLKKVWEEEVERMNMKGIQAMNEMSIARNTWARPLKGGPLPVVNNK